MSELIPLSPEQPPVPDDAAMSLAGQELGDLGLDTDTITQYYTAGASKEDFSAIGIDPAQVTKYIRGLPEDQRDYYAQQRKESYFNRDSKANLKSTEPELFEGRIRQDLEDAIHEAGYDKYAVGFVQHDAIGQLSEAVDYLNEQGGVEMVGYGPNQRFLLHDAERPMDDYPMGYYTSKIGRFVYAFPVESGVTEAPHNAVAAESGTPQDAFISNSAGETVANSKYCAGFIDDNQVFHVNPKFMKEPAVAEDEFEGGVQAQVRELHQRAEKEGRSLYSEEVATIRGLAKIVQRRRANAESEITQDRASTSSQDNANSEIAAFLKENKVDVVAASSRYEGQVKQFVNGLREQAAQEGRELNAQEIQQIRDAVKTVQDFRHTAAQAA